ncbi:MAG: LamG-like jellyroll fold domain-containing protein, partial [Planctomycetota bacterium]
MSTKLIYLISFVLVLGLVPTSASGAGDPSLLGWWKFDGDTLDSSGNERHGTLVGGPQYVEGVFNQALEFDGTDDRVNIVGYKGVSVGNPWSFATWFRTTSDGERRNLICWGASGGGNRVTVRIHHTEPDIRVASGDGNVNTASHVNDGNWHHLAVTVKANTTTVSYPDVIIYLDGQDDTEPATDADPWNLGAGVDVGIGVRATHDNRYWLGSMDEVVLYNKALTQEEVGRVMNGEILPASALASKPNPANKQTDVLREVVLSWTPGEYVGTLSPKHKVFLSENFSDVNDGIGGVTQDANSYVPAPRLDFGKTYYWRVDEANNTTGWDQGKIWHFATEPIGYAIGNVTATASSSQPGREPENTVNGSGLDDSGLLHSNVGDLNMWLSDAAGPQPSWIEFQFDKVYKLHEMWVWNANETLEPVIGLGFKDVSVEYSVNGTDYMTLGTTHEFARAPGAPDYAHNTTVDFDGASAKYVRLTANSNWGGLLPQYGLSEVRFFYIPVRARQPRPDSGATDVDVDVILGWKTGREAAQHDVYLGSDEQAVIDSNAPVISVPETSYGPLSLDLAQTYYWKINEVNTAETPTTLEGDVWNFTTSEFLVVDDFESYNDLDPDDPESNRIFNAWIDGFEQPANGSIVGYAAAPFAEQDIVHSGAQSMPLFYDNSGTARYSEAELALTPPQDWTKNGITALSLWFSGEPNNVPDQMYVKINGSKVTYDGDSGNLTRIPWQPWNIDLASLGISLQSVTKLSIGFGDETSMMPGGSGVVYVDDIRLYPYSRQLATPAEPGPDNLAAHYEFEGTASDSSGNGLHGTAMGEPAFVAGKVGQAVSLDGFNDFVEITGYKGILGPNEFSITTWIKT